jgi:uncharacterized repeat protein (TIGR03803 family)
MTRLRKSALACIVVTLTIGGISAQAQTFTVLHNFSAGTDGVNPRAGLTIDSSGSLYGTTTAGPGDHGQCYIWGCGTVYKMQHKGSGWVFNPLYSFNGGGDGAWPDSRVIFGPNGTLYGTTLYGGGRGYGSCFGNPYDYCGTVFSLRPSVTACKSALCPWTETQLYNFSGSADGQYPGGDLTFDHAGNIYGTTEEGGSGCSGDGCGTVYELTPSGSGWTKSILYAFAGGNDGAGPYSGVIFDKAGDLYGTTLGGGSYNNGTVYELTYTAGVGWTENILHGFISGNDGSAPVGGLTFDQSGNLYGTTTSAGSGGGGTVFQLAPSGSSWTYSVLYSFTGTNNGCGPLGSLVMDKAGSLYGTTYCDGANHDGNVFKLTPSGGSWTYTSLHDFTGRDDGGYPVSNVVFDAKGNLYGTTYIGGTQGGGGVVWEITP